MCVCVHVCVSACVCMCVHRRQKSGFRRARGMAQGREQPHMTRLAPSLLQNPFSAARTRKRGAAAATRWPRRVPLNVWRLPRNGCADAAAGRKTTPGVMRRPSWLACARPPSRMRPPPSRICAQSPCSGLASPRFLSSVSLVQRVKRAPRVLTNEPRTKASPFSSRHAFLAPSHP